MAHTPSFPKGGLEQAPPSLPRPCVAPPTQLLPGLTPPLLAPPLPGEEAHGQRVGVDGGEERPGARQLQVGEVLPVPRGGQQALQGLQ